MPVDDSFCRELTFTEKRQIKKLVVQCCDNYDKEYGCLPLDYGGCYMLENAGPLLFANTL